MMKNNQYLNLGLPLILTLLAWLPLTSCAEPIQENAKQMLEQMQAKDYFSSPSQVALAEAITRGDIEAMRKAIAAGADAHNLGSGLALPHLIHHSPHDLLYYNAHQNNLR
jgi:hypothetical protein